MPLIRCRRRCSRRRGRLRACPLWVGEEGGLASPLVGLGLEPRVGELVLLLPPPALHPGQTPRGGPPPPPPAISGPTQSGCAAEHAVCSRQRAADLAIQGVAKQAHLSLQPERQFSILLLLPQSVLVSMALKARTRRRTCSARASALRLSASLVGAVTLRPASRDSRGDRLPASPHTDPDRPPALPHCAAPHCVWPPGASRPAGAGGGAAQAAAPHADGLGGCEAGG